MAESRRLAGRVALVTAVAVASRRYREAFAREGAQVAFTYHRRADAANEVVAAVRLRVARRWRFRPTSRARPT